MRGLARQCLREHAETRKNLRFFGNVGFRINPDLETRFYFTALNSDSQLPGTLTKAQAQTNPRLANAGNLAGQQKRDFPLYRIANKTDQPQFWPGDGRSVYAGLEWRM